jgi:hypothetical protein
MQTPKVRKQERVRSGFQAAKATISLMRETFSLIPPPELVQAFIDHGSGAHKASGPLWQDYGQQTIRVMQKGTHLLACLWEGAWEAGNGERRVERGTTIDKRAAMDLVADPRFLPSLTVDKIDDVLRRPQT